MLTLDRFKLYARIDHADEDELIESLIRAATLPSGYDPARSRRRTVMSCSTRRCSS